MLGSNLPEDDDPYPLTYIVWAKLIGMPEVTEKNWRQVYGRAVQVQAAQGPGAMMITPALVRRHIGQQLGPYQLSAAAFRKKIGELFDERLARELKQWEDGRSRAAAAAPPTQ